MQAEEAREEARRNTRGRFEQWAKNPTCDANTLSAVHNVRLDKAAEAAGFEPSFGQSPFAIARGNTFEWGLFADEAIKLRTTLERKAVLPKGSTGYLDLRLKINGGQHVRSVDAALTKTTEWLQAIAANPPDAPTIIAAPMLKIPRGVILPEALLIVDAVVMTLQANVPVLTVGEVKVFPDRGGHTDPGQLASARAQAGLYRRALEMTLEAIGLTASLRVNPTGLLIFTWPGSNQPSIRADEDLTYQAIRAERGFSRLEEVAQAVVRDDDFSSDLPALIDRVLEADTAYGEGCLSFCDLAPRCHKRAAEADDGLILGSEASRLLGTVSISRALELMNGAEPSDDREVDLQRQLPTS